MRKGLEKGMAPHSSTLAWKIPWTEYHNLLSVAIKIRVSLPSVQGLPTSECFYVMLLHYELHFLILQSINIRPFQNKTG